MFEDKKLEKAIRQQVKVGLTIYANGEEIAFVGDQWMARTTLERMRDDLRGTLGVLAELLGFIPTDGCVRIRKTKDGYDVQEQMMSVAASQIGFFLHRETRPVRLTGLSYGWARTLWQDREGKLYGQNAERVDNGSGEALLNGADCLVIRDLNSCEEQYIKVTRPEDDVGLVRTALWQHLEEAVWVDWGDGPTGEDAGDDEVDPEQMEIGEAEG